MEDTSEDVLFESKLKEEFGKLEKDYDGLQLVLASIKDTYVCDCERTMAKLVSIQRSIEMEGVNDVLCKSQAGDGNETILHS